MNDKRTGRVGYAVMTFGGFLGLGADYYALPWSMLTYNEALDAYELDITEDQVARARRPMRCAAVAWFDWDDRQWAQHRYTTIIGCRPGWM